MLLEKLQTETKNRVMITWQETEQSELSQNLVMVVWYLPSTTIYDCSLTVGSRKPNSGRELLFPSKAPTMVLFALKSITILNWQKLAHNNSTLWRWFYWQAPTLPWIPSDRPLFWWDLKWQERLNCSLWLLWNRSSSTTTTRQTKDSLICFEDASWRTQQIDKLKQLNRHQAHTMQQELWDSPQHCPIQKTWPIGLELTSRAIGKERVLQLLSKYTYFNFR